MTNTKNTKLSSSVTIAIYEILKREKDAYGIANLIYERFYERYLKPFECNKNRHGFSMMAVSFLMIETLHSFQTGLDDTTGNGKNSFNCFFLNQFTFQNLQIVVQSFITISGAVFCIKPKPRMDGEYGVVVLCLIAKTKQSMQTNF